MTSPKRFHTLLNFLLGAATALGALVIVGTHSANAQSLTLSFRFDDGTANPAADYATLATSKTITSANNGQVFTIDVFATVTGTSGTVQSRLGLESLLYRALISSTNNTAFSTGSGVGSTGTVGNQYSDAGGTNAPYALQTPPPPYGPFAFFNAATTVGGTGWAASSSGTVGDFGTTSNGTDQVAATSGVIGVGGPNGASSTSALAAVTNGTSYLTSATAPDVMAINVAGPNSTTFDVMQFQFKIGNVNAAGGKTTLLPALPLLNNALTIIATWKDTASTAINQTGANPFLLDATGVSFVAQGTGGNTSILNMTPPTVTINSLASGTNSSTLAVANTSATDAGTYTGAFTGASTGASQNPTGTVNVPASGSVNEVITYAAPATIGPVSFGYTITNTANASDVQGAGANKSTAFTVNVGNATADNSNALPNAANPFTNATIMTGVVAHNGSYAGLESQVTGLSGTGGFNADDGTAAHKGGTAVILAGTNTLANGGAAATVAMQWRTLSTNASFNEQTGLSPTGPSGKIYNLSLLRPTTGLVSDVVNLTGLTPGLESAGGATDPFVLQMSFNPVLTAKHGTVVNSLAQNKLINLISYNPATNLWDRAVDDNTNNAITSPLDPSYGYVGSYAQFISAGQPGNGKTLAQTLGAWGVDPVNDVVWADVNHNSQFAVVPEPGTILLAGLGLMGLVGLRRRMKASAA